MKQKILSLLLFGLLGVTTALAQEREITGKVTNSKGETLPGVSVIVVETQKGAATDLDGNYKVSASTGNTLRFVFVEMKTKEVKVGAESVINVTLEENILEDVVVTGYRDISREKSTGSAVVVSTKQIENIPISSLDQILQGRSTGVLIGAGSGQPGSAANVLIRGAGSINSGTQPLYILDGVAISAGDFQTINGNDIESMTVLKDASAASIYGARGANGVIVIKTKRGKGQTRVRYNTQAGITTRTTSKFSNMNTSQRLDFERMLAEFDFRNNSALYSDVRTWQVWTDWLAAGSPSSGPELDARNALVNQLSATNTNWGNEFFRTGSFQSHDISVSGGEGRTSFYISGQYRKEDGILVNSGLERYILRANVSSESANNKFRFGLNSTVGYSKNTFIPSESGNSVANPVLGVYTALPYLTPESNKSNFILGYNPHTVVNVTRALTDNYKSVANVYAEYDITKNLTLRTSWGGDFSMDINKSSVQSPAVVADPNDPNQIGLDARGGGGRISRGQALEASFTGTTSLKYEKTFAQKHTVSAMLINEFFARNVNGFSYSGFGVNNRFINTPVGITAGTATNNFIPTVGGSTTFNRLASLFVDVQYTFDNRFNVSAIVRRDGSSRFGENKRFGTFAAGGVSWNLHNEAFMNSLQDKFLDALTVKATYGTQGNQDIANFGYLSVYGQGGNYGGIAGIVPGTPPNPDVQWEQQATLNLATNFSMFKGRLTGSFEYYNRKTSQLFVQAQQSRSSGFATINRNAGEMRNRGFEISLTGEVLKVGDFKWTASWMHTLNRSKILSLGGQPEFETGTSIIRVGLPLGSHYVVKWAGVDPATGDALYYDLEGNITPNFSDDYQQSFGTWIAPHFGSFTNTFSYKGLELSVFFAYEAEKQLFNNQIFFNQNLLGIPVDITNKDVRMLNAWTTPGQLTEIPRLDVARQFSSRDLEDGSFLRLRNLTLAYNVPAAWLKSAKLNSARVFVMGQNLLTFTKFTGFDPEDSNNIQLSQYPVPRVYTLGLDVTF